MRGDVPVGRLYRALGISDERVDYVEDLLAQAIESYDTVSEVLKELARHTELSTIEKLFAAYLLGYRVAERVAEIKAKSR